MYSFLSVFKCTLNHHRRRIILHRIYLSRAFFLTYLLAYLLTTTMMIMTDAYSFHHSVPVQPLPFRRSVVPLCRAVVPLPFFRSIATVAVAGENGNAGNVFPYT